MYPAESRREEVIGFSGDTRAAFIHNYFYRRLRQLATNIEAVKSIARLRAVTLQARLTPVPPGRLVY